VFSSLQNARGIDTTRDLRLSPSISTITKGFARVVANMKWKSVAIVTSRKFTLINGCYWNEICVNLGIDLMIETFRISEIFLFAQNE
jgi:hypothetical protein